jgi:putative photosynthetic complex assembly protein 2
MRISAKLNLFLGVPKLHNELLPDHLVFLGTYFRKRAMNALFPVSVTLGTVVTTLLLVDALSGGVSQAATAGGVLVASLLALAVLEHWFMVLPIEDTALWRWALRARAAASPGRRNETTRDDRREIGPAIAVPLATTRGL